MFAVIMIVLNGLIGLSLLIGGFKHIEQRFNLQGANTFLAVLIPLSFLSLLLPNFTMSSEIGTLSKPQMVFLTIATLALYGTFLAAQTMRHSGFFVAPARDGESLGSVDLHDHEDLDVRGVSFHSVLLVAYMLPIVLLSKSMAKIVDFGIAQAGLPAALGGLLVAVLVLSPEGMAALKAARDDRLQRSINICLGSGLATIGLTVPAILAIGLLVDLPVVLGLEGTEALLLVLTALVAVVNFAGGRANMIHGLVHLILFAAYVVLIFD
jgi:Ca2+:H+ antiporter